MLKSSPLKHREGRHTMLSDQAHEAEHKDDVVADELNLSPLPMPLGGDPVRVEKELTEEEKEADAFNRARKVKGLTQFEIDKATAVENEKEVTSFANQKIIDDLKAIQTGGLTKEEIAEQAEKADKIINGEGTQQKIANWASKTAKGFDGLKDVSTGHWLTSKALHFLSGTLDQKGTSFTDAKNILEDKVDPNSPNYDAAYAEKTKNFTNKQKKEELEKQAKIQLTKDLSENEIVAREQEYLDGLTSSQEKAAKKSAEKRITTLSKTAKENSSRLEKVKLLSETFTSEVNDYAVLSEGIIADLNLPAKDYQKLVDSGKMTVEDAQEEIRVLNESRARKIKLLKNAQATLLQKEKNIANIKDSYAGKFKELEELTAVEDKLDNINNAVGNLFAAGWVSGEGMMGNFLHLSGSLLTGAGNGIADAADDYHGVPKHKLVTNKSYNALQTLGNGMMAVGGHAKKMQAEHQQHLSVLPTGWNNVVEKGLLGVAENIPMMAVASATGGGSLLASASVYGLSGAGDKSYQMSQDLNEDGTKKQYTTKQLIMAPLAYGAFESVTMIPEMLMLRGAFKGKSKFGGSKIDTKVLPSHNYANLGRAVTGFGKATVLGELPQEIFTQVGHNWTERAILGNKDVQYSDGIDADFLIKVLGSSGTFYTAPRALQGAMMLSHGMSLESDQVQMQKNSDKLVKAGAALNTINKNLSKLKPGDANFETLTEQKNVALETLSEAQFQQEKTIQGINDRFGQMDTKSINKLRTLGKKGSKLRERAQQIKKDDSLTRSEKRAQLKDLQTKFEAIEGDKAKIINNKSKYKLEHGNKIRSLENQAAINLRDKNKGKEPTQEQIEVEAERINDETNINADKRVNEAKQAISDNINKFASERTIAKINSFDATKPIDKIEAETAQEAREALANNLREKGLSETAIKDQVDQITDASWSTGQEGASAYMFQPKFKDAKPDPETHMFDKHQVMVVNSAKSKTGANPMARGHEILHAIVYKGFKASGKAFAPMANAMMNKIKNTDPAGMKFLEQRMAAYTSKNGTELDDAYHEEVVMAISDGMRAGYIQRTPNVVLGVRNAVKKAAASIGIDNKVMINNEQDMLDIIADYGRGLDKGGEMSVDVQKLAKGEVVLGDDIAIDRTAQRKSNEATRARMSMDNLSKEAKEIVTESIASSGRVKAQKVNDAFKAYEDGKTDSWTALTEIGEAYDPMFNKAIKQFENENNITFGQDQIEDFKFEALHSPRGIKGSLFADPSKPGKKIYDRSLIETPARYLNGLLPQRMIEFGVKAIPNLNEYYAADVSELKNMEATETADMTVDQETVKTRDKRDLSSLAVVTPAIITEVNDTVSKIISRSMVDPQATAESILDNIMDVVGKKFTKSIIKEMGTINTVGDRVIPSDEYKAFHANGFETIVKALPIKTIKKKYSKLFNIEKIGREKDKKVNPVTGKVTYPGKGIFQITPIPKAQFGSYFLNGKLTTLRARQAALATEIGQSLAKDATYLIAKDPKIIDKISQMRDIQGMSTVVGIQNEINEIANQLDKKKDEGGSLDVVKLAKDLGKLDANAKQDYFKGLSVLGNAYLNSGHSMIGAFNKAFPSPMFGEYRESILKDTVKYMEQYERQNSKYKEVGIKPSETITDFITNEVLMKDQLKAVKAQYGLGKGMVDAKNLEQLDSVRSAAAKIAQELGIEKADRFLGFMASTGKNGGTSALANPKTGKLEYTNADFYLKKISKETAKTGLTAKQQKASDAKIEKYSKAIAEGKEPTSHPYGYFAGIGDFANVVLKGLSGYTNKYKSPIVPNAPQNVGVVNKNFSFEANKKSADVNADFLVELMDVMVKLNNTLDANGNPVISKNDMAMIQMSLGNGGMNTPLAAAANVAFMTNDGNKNSTDHIYEHLIPRRVINAALAGYANGTMTKPELKTLLDQFQVAVIPREQADIVDKFFKSSMPADWIVGIDVLNRYFNMRTFGDINMPLVDLKTGEVNAKSKVFADAANALKPKDQVKQSKDLSKAISESRIVKEPKGITVLDFDDTLATTKSGVRAKIPNKDGLPKPKRKVIFLAGGAGSGKGNVISKLGLESQGFKIVNSDISLEWLKKNNGLPENMNDFTKEQKSTLGKLQHQARGIAKRKMTKYQGDGNGVVVDGTGGSIKSMQDLVSQFEADGYDVSMTFVETSLPVALERNAARKERSLLDKIVTKNHEAVQGNKDGFKQMFGDRFMEVNTDNLSQEDAMPTKLTEQMNDFVSGYENRRLDAEEFARDGADILDQGGTFDFSEFNKVVEGETAPLFNKAMKLQGKFGPKDMFVLTARPAESAPAIFEFLQANGLNIPIENITGLANSTPEAKALWMAEKVGDGYNDFYFADDALQNVQAVQNILDQMDVKSKVQQAKVKFSKDISPTFNDILESTTGVESQKEFSDAQARLRGRNTEYKGIIPASAQDFQGLLYNFLGKGKKGEADMAFFKKALIDPFARGIKELNTSRQSAATDFENLNKNFPEVKKILNKNIEGLDYTNDQAIRVYLWNKAGFEVPGLSKRDLAALTSVVQNNPEMQAYADAIGLISKKDDGYSKPKDYWLAESIASDLLSDGAIGDVRANFLAEWQQNVDQMFSKANLNKIEAVYGSKFREALEDSLYRMRTGKNRPTGGGRLMNGYMNWVNNSVGAIMFFNMRSAILQTISATNYMNWSFNNPAKAALAFANQPQFWKDFSMIFNSPYLKQRRSGNQRGINEAELSEAVAGSENKAKTAIAWLLKKGFLPTQLADSFAIASGGASFYRNKVKALVKEGMSQEQAETQAFLEFQEVTEVSQQSARPDMISQQQASPLGRLILSFQNTPMQYARIINKAARDLANGRGDYKTHMSKIAYYGVAQGILFGSLQSALFAALGDDEEEEYDKKKERIINGMIDSLLSGIGYGGKAISTAKNTIKEYAKQKDKGWNADHTYTILQLLGFSPPIGSKLRKIYGSIQTEQFNQGVFKKRGLTLDNPIWSAVGNVVEGVTNVPLGRLAQKMLNIDNALDNNNKWWERAALLLGWNTWDLGIKDKDITAVKDEIKEEKKIESKKKAEIKKEKKKKEKEEENKAVIEDNKKKSKKDGVCSAVSKSGKRCKAKVVEGKLFCTVHEKAEQNETGEKSQCKKVKKGNKRCKMQTSNKSGYCYYHD